MRETASFHFPPFHLDERSERLWHGDRAVRLTPRAFAVLRYLVTRAGELVPKDEIIDAVWETPYISDAALTTCMYELRQALGERAQTPQFIETVRGRGYRFIASVRTEAGSHAAHDSGLDRPALPPTESASAQPLIGRETALMQLRQWLQAAFQGKRQMGFVTGEAGIGKTTLLDAFMTQVTSEVSLWMGHGQCIEQYGAGEAYLPLLEALGRLCRGPDGARLVSLLRQQAPSWLAQLPAQLTEEERESSRQQESPGTPQRMMRELAEAVEVLTVERPLVLVLEDLHWCDPSTLEWLAYAARRRDPARLLVLATYRPVDAILHAHAIHPLVQELRMHGQCEEIALDYWSEGEIDTYLAQRFLDTPLPTGLTQLIHQRTSGNPLFVTAIINELVKHHVLQEGAAGLAFSEEPAIILLEVPESLRQLIERQLERLPSEERTLLEAASVVGIMFAAATVAAATDFSPDDAETRLVDLASHHQLIKMNGVAEWPDGTVNAQCVFIHDLYREVIYTRVPVGQRVRMHLQIGTRLESAYGAEAREIAAELAMHFVKGRDTQRAVQYLHAAGENALRRSAPQEAVGHLTQGLVLCATLPNTAAHMQCELMLQLALGNALVATKGYTQDVATVYNRVRELCQQVGETPQLFPALHGLAATCAQRGELRTAQELCETFFQLAQREQESALLLQAHRMLASLWVFLGQFSQAREHGELGIALYDAQSHRGHAFQYAQDLGMSCLIYAAFALWYLGYPDQSVQRCHEALALAEELDHPQSLAWAYSFASTLHQLRRETRQAQERAEASIAICREQGYAFRLSRGMILRGWSLTAQGHVEEGMTQMYQGLADHRATGIVLGLPSYLALMAEGCWYGEYTDEGLAILTEALETVRTTGECRWEAELYRLQGEFLLRQSQDQRLAAESCWRRALSVARRQQAKSWELRAAMSLSRLWQSQGKRDEARDMLAPVHGWFTEGFDTTDLQEAKVLLDELEA